MKYLYSQLNAIRIRSLSIKLTYMEAICKSDLTNLELELEPV